jgi:hypothetical protein
VVDEMNDKAKIVDAGNLHKYRTEIPNTVDDMGLSVYAYRLYGHLKRVAGDAGKCWQSTRTLADACGMAAGTVSKAKIELKEAGLIKIKGEESERGGRDYHVIEIVDIWLENFIKYTASSPHELASSPDEQPSSYDELASSPGELKKNSIKHKPIKNNPIKNGGAKAQRDPLLDNGAVILYKSIIKLTANDVQRKLIAESVTDLELWNKTLVHWKLIGWSPRNVIGMVDLYSKGGPGDNGNSKPNGKPKKVNNAIEYLKQQLEADDGNQ